MQIYTDGATSNNGKENAHGGWAFICVDTGYADNGYVPQATNQICELLAAIEACKYAEQHIPADVFNYQVTIFSDSAYLVNCYKDKWYNFWINNGWVNSKKQPVANKDLWEQLIPYFTNPIYCFKKVKGHSDNEYNNAVDSLAVKGKNRILIRDIYPSAT